MTATTTVTAIHKTIRKQLFSHLNALKSPFETLFETESREPNLPYQSVFLQLTTANTHAISDKPHAEYRGYLQITLHIPLNQGTALLDEQADLLSQHFYPFSWQDEHLQILVQNPPLAGGILHHNGHLAMPITLYFQAYTH